MVRFGGNAGVALWTGLLMTRWMMHAVQSHRRCYCNDASCVSTGYMCKSEIGICFSRVSYSVATSVRFYHACAELLSADGGSACAAGIAGTGSHQVINTGRGEERTDVTCCATDMCNYRDQRNDPWSPASTLAPSNTGHLGSSTDRQRSPSDGHVWFQALAIAVTIIGTVILLLLLLLTIKVLVIDRRSIQRQRSNKSGQAIDLDLGDRTKTLTLEKVRCHVTDRSGFHSNCFHDDELRSALAPGYVPACHLTSGSCNSVGDLSLKVTPRRSRAINTGSGSGDLKPEALIWCNRCDRCSCCGQLQGDAGRPGGTGNQRESGPPALPDNRKHFSDSSRKVFPVRPTYRCVALVDGATGASVRLDLASPICRPVLVQHMPCCRPLVSHTEGQVQGQGPVCDGDSGQPITRSQHSNEINQ